MNSFIREIVKGLPMAVTIGFGIYLGGVISKRLPS